MNDLTELFDIGDEITVEVTAPMDFMRGYVTYVDKYVVSVQWYSGIKIYNFELSESLNNITKNKQTKEQPMKEQSNIKPKNIKPEDEVTITVTYHDLALVYAVIGRVLGTDSKLYDLAQEILDPDFSKSYEIGLSRKTLDEIVRYGKYCKEFEALLFPQEPIETEQQKQIRELREQAEATN